MNRQQHEKWLSTLTAIPTAAGREDRVIRWIEGWVKARRNVTLRRDRAGNLFIQRAGRRAGRPIYMTAHLDHPAFVVRRVLPDRRVELEFRGGVDDAYFEDALIEILDAADRSHRARIESLDPAAKPFKRVIARMTRPAGKDGPAPGDVARWSLGRTLPRIRSGKLHAHACDDLAAVAAALAAFDVLRRRRGTSNVGVLLTRAEEVGFVGTLALCVARELPKSVRLICLENSRSFAESPIGAGPILRVGDRLSVFSPELTNRLGAILDAHAQRTPSFRWQRKLMPGGACEATAFSVYGYASTCICLPLGNYHNMTNIDGVRAGQRPARVGPEIISVDDFHHLVDALIVCITRLDSASVPSLREKLGKQLERNRVVLERP